MWIDEDMLSNVVVALCKYSEWLSDNEPRKSSEMHPYWEQTRREVWQLRDKIQAHFNNQPSLAEKENPSL